MASRALSLHASFYPCIPAGRGHLSKERQVRVPTTLANHAVSFSASHTKSGKFAITFAEIVHVRVGIEDQLKKVKIPGPSALALSAL